MAVVPDMAGFADAQARLLQGFGRDVVFEVPVAAVYDPAEPIDPETGRPHDPFATPVSGGGRADVPKRVSWVTRPLGTTRDPTGAFVSAPIGIVDTANAALILTVEDYPDVEDADRVRDAANVFTIVGWVHDALGSYERWLAYLQDA